MYRVLKLRGVNEPWYLDEYWQETIIWQQECASLATAFQLHDEQLQFLRQQYAHMKQKYQHCEAFWDEEDQYYCEACEDMMQVYTGLCIMDEQMEIITL